MKYPNMGAANFRNRKNQALLIDSRVNRGGGFQFWFQKGAVTCLRVGAVGTFVYTFIE